MVAVNGRGTTDSSARLDVNISIYLLMLFVTNLFELVLVRSVKVSGFSDNVPDLGPEEKLA